MISKKALLLSLVVVVITAIVGGGPFLIAATHPQPLQLPPIHGCYTCAANSDPHCCAPGQMCPGQIPCCGKKPGSWSCNQTCQPVCEPNVECGDGGCAGAGKDVCGKCPAGTACQDNSRCQKCCPSYQKCGMSQICKGVQCGRKCPAGEGCLYNKCQKCCANNRTCGFSPACNGVSCGTCAAGDGCNYVNGGQCEPCCPKSRTCGTRSFCNVSCGKCASDAGCDGDVCKPCCSGRFPCEKTPWCLDHPSCGTCGKFATCEKWKYECKCKQHCQCGSPSCPGCPKASAGCVTASGGGGGGGDELATCSCRGPRSPKTLYAANFVYKRLQMYRGGCTPPAYECGGYSPIGARPSSPLSVDYQGMQGFSAQQTLLAIFESPTGKSLPGNELFVYFGRNNTVVNCCDGTNATTDPLTFQVVVTNCTKVHYKYCFTRQNMSCFTNEGSKNCTTVQTLQSRGNQSGVWFKNPNTSIFHLEVSVSDQYYTCNSCGNQMTGQKNRKIS